MNGRLHYYEGYDIAAIGFPVRVLGAWGVRTMIITNACGGLNPAFKAGDLMVINDHINFMGANPLRGPNDDRLGPRFVDMVGTYTEELRELAHKADGDLREGVYLADIWPSEKEVEAHAHYGAAIVHELDGEAEAALKEFYQAALDDPIPSRIEAGN